METAEAGISNVGLIEKEVLDKYLTPMASEIVNNCVEHTVVEHYYIKGYDGEEPIFSRKAYLVEFMSVLIHGDKPTEKQIQKFCEKINELASVGDIIIGALCRPIYYVIPGLAQCTLNFYPVSILSYEELHVKHTNWFIQEGDLPKFILE